MGDDNTSMKDNLFDPSKPKTDMKTVDELDLPSLPDPYLLNRFFKVVVTNVILFQNIAATTVPCC